MLKIGILSSILTSLVLIFIITGCSSPQCTDGDNDGCCDVHDGSSSDSNIPTNNIEFENYRTINRQVEAAVSNWIKDDMLGIVGELASYVPLPLADDLVDELLFYAIETNSSWQITQVTKSLNEDIDVEVPFSLTIARPDASWEKKPNLSCSNPEEISWGDFPSISMKKYEMDFTYDLVFYDDDIVNYEMRSGSFEFEGSQ